MRLNPARQAPAPLNLPHLFCDRTLEQSHALVRRHPSWLDSIATSLMHAKPCCVRVSVIASVLCAYGSLLSARYHMKRVLDRWGHLAVCALPTTPPHHPKFSTT